MTYDIKKKYDWNYLNCRTVKASIEEMLISCNFLLQTQGSIPPRECKELGIKISSEKQDDKTVIETVNQDLKKIFSALVK